MLGSTTLLWATADRLFGRRAAFFAAALFAVLGPSLQLGAFATYDAMALFLLALASWLVVRAGERQDATVWMIAAGIALAVANATAYSSAIFDPVVVLLALVTAFPRPGGKLAAARAVTLLAIVAVILTPALLLGGSRYWHGISVTTLQRTSGTDSALTVITHFWSWTGIIVVAAACGAVIGWLSQSGRARAWLLTLLAAAALLVPAEQASLHTTASLNKHGAMGAWFAAIAAGYAVDRLIATAPAGTMRLVTGGACVVALCFPVIARGQPVMDVRDQLAELLRLYRDIPPAGGSRHWPHAGRGPVDRGILPGVGEPVGAMVEHAEYRLAIGQPHRRTEHESRDRRGRQRGHVRHVHPGRLLLDHRAELRRHDRSGREHRRGHSPESSLPRSPGRALWAGPVGPALGKYVIWQYEPQG